MIAVSLDAIWSIPAALAHATNWTALVADDNPRLWAHEAVLTAVHHQLGDDAVIHSYGLRPSHLSPPAAPSSSPYDDPALPPHALLLHLPSGAPAVAVEHKAVTTATLLDARQPLIGLAGGAPALEILYTRPWFVDPSAPTPCLRMSAAVYDALAPAHQRLWSRVGSLLARI